MQEIFQTGHGTLRKALRILEQKGLIEVRQDIGGGAVVMVIGTGQMTETLPLMVQSQQLTPDHLIEFHEAVDGAVTAAASLTSTTAAVLGNCWLVLSWWLPAGSVRHALDR